MGKNLKFGFVLMPFSADFKNQWELALVPALEELGLLPRRADEDSLGTNIIVEDITRLIFNATIILADLTGRNPNVMYELGLSHAAKKAVIILAQAESDIPFDVRHVRYLLYHPLDLKSLRQELVRRVKSTLAMSEAPAPDFFPELRIMRAEDQQELQYLRERNDRLDIEVEPFTADVFFNGKWVGQTPQTVYVNSNSSRNVISATAAEHLEYYENISEDTLEKGRLSIRLEPGRPKAAQEKRMPRWLRLRRRDPNSPVLMKAISQYLCEIGDFEDALEEAKELVLAVPNWPVAHGHLGDVYHRMGNYLEAIEHWNTAIALKPDYGVPFLGLACTYSLTGQYSRCLEVMEKISASKDLVIYYAKLGNWRISSDSDFDPVRVDPEFGARFQLLASEIERKADSVRV